MKETSKFRCKINVTKTLGNVNVKNESQIEKSAWKRAFSGILN